MQPPATVEDLDARIQRVRQTPLYEKFAGRTVNVIGLEQAEGQSRTEKPKYAAVAVVISDAETKYHENPSAFDVPQGLAATEWQLVRDAMQRDISLASVSNFSPQISNLMIRMAVTAVGLSLLAIVAYIWLRFGSLRYGLSAIGALVHDVTITLGVVAGVGLLAGTAVGDILDITPFRIDLAMIAAILTIIGYSLNDTIVVYDRIRENRGRLAYATPPIINESINQTISRTVLTSGTTILAVLILYLFSGEGIHGFAFAMIVGIIVGTYSSISIASPLLLVGRPDTVAKKAGAEDKTGKGQAKPAGA
jgi:SecD/SecF fusion protein